MSLRNSRNKVHKAEKNLEGALEELSPEDNVDHEDFEEEIERIKDLLQDMKKIMKSKGQMDFRRFSE